MARAKDRPPVILIHGGFCGPAVWDNFAKPLQGAGYRTQAPALRHHDKPSPKLGEMGLGDYADDLEALIAGCDAPPILIGHSLGGLLAQMLAARTKIHAAIMLAPSAPWGVPPSTLFEIAAAQTMLLNVGFWNSILPPSRDIAIAHAFDRFAPAAREKMLDGLVPESGRATFQVMHWGLDMGRASEVEARAVRCPMLFITGDADRINPPGTVARAAALYKNRGKIETRVETMPGMSHWLIGEPGWEKVADRCVEWLAGI